MIREQQAYSSSKVSARYYEYYMAVACFYTGHNACSFFVFQIQMISFSDIHCYWLLHIIIYV
jgi:hypothetical protein